MRYEKSTRVGEVWHTEEYEGSPEEIAELMKQQNKPQGITEFAASINISPDIVEKVKEEISKAFVKIPKSESEGFRQG